MDVCPRCRKKQVFGGAYHCAACLCEVIENRVKKALGGSGRAGVVKIAFNGSDSLPCVVAAFICKKLGRQFVKIARQGAVLAATADDRASGFLEALICSRNPPATDSLLGSTTEKELVAYANIKKLKYKASEDKGIKRSLQELQGKHAGVIESLARSSEEWQGIRR